MTNNDQTQPMGGGQNSKKNSNSDPVIDFRSASSADDKSFSINPQSFQDPTKYTCDQIGPYRILEQLGEGGMGAVFLAEQREPVVRRVALKIIKAGMDTGQVIARFEAERQALAMMDHPNIAKVFDAGTTETGRPYFVMELVKGVPITAFCDNQKMGINERLKLFSHVCNAVQHAHQKGIIHRDLKPSNILVGLHDDEPIPKVIDFGLAKATNQRLTEKTMFTAHGQVLGTLEYMSPEQAQLNELDVDTRSDIYSLGVILYELLAGSTPLKRKSLREAGFMEILKRIKEEEPERPSSRISHSSDSLESISSYRKIEPRKFSNLMKGELDWVILKAIDKDRTRRYETAAGFASDIRRFLSGEPIDAKPPSAKYLLQKMVRKHRVAFSVISFSATLLLLAAIISSGFAFWAISEARAADISKSNADAKLVEFKRLADSQVVTTDLLLRIQYHILGLRNGTSAEHQKMIANEMVEKLAAHRHTELRWRRLLLDIEEHTDFHDVHETDLASLIELQTLARETSDESLKHLSRSWLELFFTICVDIDLMGHRIQRLFDEIKEEI